jgi:hypothetical protein
MEPTLAPPASLGAAADDAADAAEAEPSADETCGSAEELGEEGEGDMQQQQQQPLEEGGEECSPLVSCGQAYETVRDYCLARTQVGRVAGVLLCYTTLRSVGACRLSMLYQPHSLFCRLACPRHL